MRPEAHHAEGMVDASLRQVCAVGSLDKGVGTLVSGEGRWDQVGQG